MEIFSNDSYLNSIPHILPIIPTIDVVVFPNTIVPLLVLDEKIIHGINQSLETSKMVLLLAAKQSCDKSSNYPSAISTNDLHTTGTVASVIRLIKVPEGGIKILVQGIAKAQANQFITNENLLTAELEICPFQESPEDEIQAHLRNIKETAQKMAQSGQTLSPDFHIILSKIQDPEKLCDFILSHLNISVEQAQQLLESKTKADLLKGIYQALCKEIEVSEVQEKIKSNARESINKSQKEYFLREQLRAIKRELGEDDQEEVEQMRMKLEGLPISDETRQEVNRHINRLEKMAPDSLEATVTRNYLEWFFAMPWGIETVDNLDIENAKKVLDTDHFGLDEIKDRILDFISIRKLKDDCHTPIICFLGPPGTGKTSLGKSIARALGRTYHRVSLGGVKDEAEIRGHRRTYVGAMPGRFIQGIRKAGSCNPLMVIDELDKIGSDFRGDPSAAMLEVLDPHQNSSFYDNYLGIPFDLSKVIFIATANSAETISGPLRDRMEIINLSGYTTEEKINIARKHIVKKSFYDAGLGNQNITIADDVLQQVIMQFTRESGVRQLERTIRKLATKAARSLIEKNSIPQFTNDNIETYLGPRKFLDDEQASTSQVGITNALAWTVYGGEMMKVEAILMPGKGILMLTGQLGDIMKESAQAALSYARAHAREFNIAYEQFTEFDLHIHVPAGAIPKDGPSAGITMLTAILSALTKRPVDGSFAMTGELNLRGDVMPIGGVKEKILAAKRNGIKNIILPEKNRNDLINISDITKDITIYCVAHANEVIDRVLLAPESPIYIPKKQRRAERDKQN
ncbi:MAG TPA: endopeptidase La [Candidatus Babeliales bacterium]|nr:endopeptidase La [Candidatus Babeliales bacterium]